MVIGYNVTMGADRNVAAIVVLAVGLACFISVSLEQAHKQPLAENLEQLQEQFDRFDQIYNTERPHLGLPGRITPAQAWG